MSQLAIRGVMDLKIHIDSHCSWLRRCGLVRLLRDSMGRFIGVGQRSQDGVRRASSASAGMISAGRLPQGVERIPILCRNGGDCSPRYSGLRWFHPLAAGGFASADPWLAH
jgi:hypothetical protein